MSDTGKLDDAPTASAVDAGGTSHDDRVDAVADERCRRVLRRVDVAGGSLTLSDLVDEIVATGTGTTPLATDPDHVALRLHHVHLPKLAEAGLVEYDPAEENVALTGAGERWCSAVEEL